MSVFKVPTTTIEFQKVRQPELATNFFWRVKLHHYDVSESHSFSNEVVARDYVDQLAKQHPDAQYIER